MVMTERTYKLIHRGNEKTGHHFYRRDDDALIVADHSGNGPFDEPPENPEDCDDGACVVIHIEDEARHILLVRDGRGDTGTVQCSKSDFNFARREMGSVIGSDEACSLEKDIYRGVKQINKALERYIRAFPATSTHHGDGNCFYNLYDAEDAMDFLNKLKEKVEELGVEF